ncbi:hypothetical protein CYV15_04845 [Riemerella anatipestifer]|uniref:hypothetical protein n=1 Tax=Riemerella anatipestifer TaxID=34085 RepID=UPI000D141916|nr:hypothetical protein [Riemerella anatipestifer]MDD1524906.1 hypothetical protein [Riemerella anatipestifer]MDY3362744.1 hypothetical protein [Riemerella anatipestifer]MDY3521396.1 hypothetical protein [Riemerella anatipestifer]MDY3532579.1 hypothetical protein [Riemerella anatipestifer]MDY3534867.1 hypothetical protein [Riemerella anatipestifer]
MKIVYLFLACVVAGVFIECNDKGTTTTPSPNLIAEQSLVQPQKTYKGTDGTSITIVYFAKGDEVAVNLEKDGVKYELNAKGTNHEGNPIFEGSLISWEILQDGHSGKLTHEGENFIVYKEE